MEKRNEAGPQQRILGRSLAVAEQDKVTGGWDNYHNPVSSWDLDNGQFSGLLIYDDRAPGQRPFQSVEIP
ncbi:MULTISPECIES: hypothetical protein [unclassified Luteimonas]